MMKRSHKIGVFCCCLLPVVTSWIRSGRGMEERWFMPVLAVVTIVFGVAGLWRNRREWVSTIQNRKPFALLRDPVFWCGLVFLALLVVQWQNAGRELVFNEEAWKWEYGPPPNPSIPSSFDRAEADQMLCWFFPAWVLLLLVRHWPWGKKALVRVLHILLFNGILLSILGIAQYASGTRKQFWFRPLSRYFFSAFPYPNNAASFFVLCLALAMALFLSNITKHRRERKMTTLVYLVLCIALCFVGAILALSRAGIIMAFTLVIVFTIYFFVAVVPRMPPANRVNASAAMLAIMLLVVGGMFAYAGDAIQRELGRAYEEIMITRIVNPPPGGLFSIRYPLWIPAWHIFMDYPWFGCGGWGFRYLRQLYLPEGDVPWLQDRRRTASYGFANVHHDILQFLAEFGILGTALLMACVLTAGRRFWLHPYRGGPLFVFCHTGMMLVVLHSFIDLPFRCPAILFYWVVMLAVLEKIISLSQHARRTKSA